MRSQLGTLWVRLWKDLKSLKSGWQITVPVVAISGKRVNGLMTPCRQLRLRNRWLHAGDFCENDLVEKLSEAYIGRPEWFGPTSTFFFDLVRSGTVPHRAAWLVHKHNHGSRTNGSVMRGFPLGIFWPAPEVYGISVACSRLTHYDPVAGHCSAFLNVMVSDMCRGASRAAAFRNARSLCTDTWKYTQCSEIMKSMIP